MPTFTGTATVKTSRGTTLSLPGSFSVNAVTSTPKRVFIGVYDDTSNLPADGKGWTDLGMTSDYVQPTNRLNRAAWTARFKKGISANLTKTFKSTVADDGTVTTLRPWIGDLVKGPSAPTYAAADAAMEGWVEDVLWAADEAARIDPTLMVWANVLAEARKLSVGTPTQVFGDSADPFIMGTFQSEFAKRINERRGTRTNLRTHTWFMGYRQGLQPDFEDRQFAGTITRGRFDDIGLDPYASGGQTAWSAFAKADIDWAKAQPGYSGQGFIFSEGGMPRTFGEAKYAGLLTDIGDQLRALGVRAVVVFNRPRDRNNTFYDLPTAVARFRESCAREKALPV